MGTLTPIPGHDVPWVRDYISMTECVHGHVYRLHCRHLTIGAWDSSKQEFTGIRTKFKSRFLDAEEHWDCGPPHGTACPVEDLGALPGGVLPTASSLTCMRTGRPVSCEESPDGEQWRYDDGTLMPDEYGVTTRGNPTLYIYLKDLMQRDGLWPSGT